MPSSEEGDIAFLLEQMLDAAIELQGADFGDIQLYDAEDGILRIVAHRGVGEEFLEHFGSVNAEDTSACGTALKLGQRIVIEDVTTHAPYAPHLGSPPGPAIAGSIAHHCSNVGPRCHSAC